MPRAGVTTTMATVAPEYYLVGSTDRDAVSYTVGEEIVFDVRYTRDGEDTMPCPLFAWKLRGDDGAVCEGETSGASGHVTVRTSLAKAGFVRLTVNACGADGKPLPGVIPFEGGACAEIASVAQAGGEPADFDAFWKRTIESELDTTEPVFLMKEEFRCGDPGDIVYDIRVACPGPAAVSGYLRMPRNAAPGSLPIRVSYRGYGVRSAELPAKATAISVSLNQQGSENGHPGEYYDRLRAEKYEGWGFGEQENQSPDTCDFKYLLLRALQAIRAAKTLPEWDGKNITVLGGSMGAFQAMFAAAMEPAVTAADICIPWMCDLEAPAKLGRLRGWRPADAPALPYYDTVNLAKRVRCPVRISAGLGDDTCPPSGAVALYRALPGEKSLTLLQGRTHHYILPGGAKSTVK